MSLLYRLHQGAMFFSSGTPGGPGIGSLIMPFLASADPNRRSINSQTAPQTLPINGLKQPTAFA